MSHTCHLLYQHVSSCNDVDRGTDKFFRSWGNQFLWGYEEKMDGELQEVWFRLHLRIHCAFPSACTSKMLHALRQAILQRFNCCNIQLQVFNLAVSGGRQILHLG